MRLPLCLKLLNAGYLIATDPARRLKYGLHHDFTAFCFHDVDCKRYEFMRCISIFVFILARRPLGQCILKTHLGLQNGIVFEPEPMPIHIAAAWSRYPYDKYVGGIFTMSARHMAITNG